ncbi:hypothetical protein PCANC_09426 [Puccinia coronata f. sp. avenae]|uniref:Oxidation resistance protein 1 n=1 Tax=Puccinia coronata f. sp. avenae TaxID=200324 RepID=A0A2N5SUH1_9BASI|nr:hypothetical protein PCANC_09426 [Puccinia coronata f. sp. avenae]
MEDLLEEFDPLSQNHTKQNSLHKKPSSAHCAHEHAAANIRKLSPNAHPLFSTATTTTDQANTCIVGKIKPQADHLSSNDLGPLGFLSDNTLASEQPAPQQQEQQNSLLLQAQIRSKFRQDALAKHLAHEPFRPQSPALQPPITSHHAGTTPLPKPLITLSKLDQEPMTCFIDPAATSHSSPLNPTETPNPPASSTKKSPTDVPGTIKIPSQIFQNQLNKCKAKNETSSPKNSQPVTDSSNNHAAKSPPRMTKALDQHKLAAALLEDFDEFVSATHSTSPRPASNPTSRSGEQQHAAQEFQTFKSASSSFSSTTKPPFNNNNNNNNSGHSTPRSVFEGHEGRPNPIQFVGADPQSQLVMDDELAEGIRLHLPTRLKIPSVWRLMYSIDQHGTSLGTLYSKVSAISSLSGAHAGCILALKDQDGNRFGAFVNEAFRPSKEYYGTGECFLWKAVMFEPGDFRIGVTVKAYLWTGANDYMILSDHDLLSIGGGDGKFGLWIDANLDKGASSTCPAFNNEVLCTSATTTKPAKGEPQKDGTFEVIGLECWTVSNS